MKRYTALLASIVMLVSTLIGCAGTATGQDITSAVTTLDYVVETTESF